MSFAGHVYDMIRRDKENREMKNRRRERNKDRQNKFLKSDVSSYDPEITLEEFEEISQQIKERELKRKDQAFRRTIIVLGSLLVLLLIFWLIVLFIF